MSINFTAGKFKAWADGGTPLTTARLYTYVIGSTVHKVAYTDYTLATPCTYVSDGVGGLYIAMNSRGEAAVHLASGGYTLTLKTAAGATIYSSDEQAGTTASGIFSALDTDAAIDGTTDDSTILTTFHAAVNGHVHYPIGKYNLDGGLDLVNYGSGIIGEGNGGSDGDFGTFLTTDSTANAMITITNADGFKISDLYMFGQYVSATPASSTPHLVTIAGGTAYGRFENIRFTRAAVAVFLQDCIYVSFNHCTFAAFSGDAVIKQTYSSNAALQATNTTFASCSISPSDSNVQTDCFRQEGPGGSTKFSQCVFTFGRRGIYVKDSAASGVGGTFFYFSNGGMENNELENIRVENSVTSYHWMIGDDSYFSNDGDANNFYFGSGAADVHIGACYVRGGGRSGIYFNGQNLVVSGTKITNVGRYSTGAKSTHSITAIANSGGLVSVTATVTNTAYTASTRQQPFQTGEWIVIAGNTSGLDGEWKVTRVSDTVFTLDGSVYAAQNADGTARIMSAEIHIGPLADEVNLNPGYLGKSLNGSFAADYAYIIESSNRVKWSLDNLSWDGHTRGLIKYTPTVPPTDCYDWKDRWETMVFEQTGATATGYFMRRVTPGIYAIIAVEGTLTAGTADITGAAMLNGGTYVESATTVINTVGQWEHLRLDPAILVRVDDTHKEMGIRVVATAGGANLRTTLIYIRLA